jgi:inorganic pyrophosphatase
LSPYTLAEDGDPLDVLILMDEPGCTGSLVECRVIGAICGEQSENGKRIRNDCIVGVAIPSHTHSSLQDIKDLNPTLLREIGNFFVNYHQQYDKKFRVIGNCGARDAWKMVKKAAKPTKGMTAHLPSLIHNFGPTKADSNVRSF